MGPCPLLIQAVVLAGGRSSRMGRDKRFLSLRGEFLVDRALRMAGEALGVDADQVLLCGDVPGRKCIRDLVPGLGPMGGLVSVVQHLGASLPAQPRWLLVIPTDMPLLTEDILRKLVQEMETGRSFSFGAIGFEGYEMPFLVWCHPHLIEDLHAVSSIRALQTRVGIRRIPLGEIRPGAMMNINSPGDWEALVNELKA